MSSPMVFQTVGYYEYNDDTASVEDHFTIYWIQFVCTGFAYILHHGFATVLVRSLYDL